MQHGFTDGHSFYSVNSLSRISNVLDTRSSEETMGGKDWTSDCRKFPVWWGDGCTNRVIKAIPEKKFFFFCMLGRMGVPALLRVSFKLSVKG